MPRMISARRPRVCAKVQESRLAFCCISRALTRDTARVGGLAGAEGDAGFLEDRTASGVVGMLAPSATA